MSVFGGGLKPVDHRQAGAAKAVHSDELGHGFFERNRPADELLRGELSGRDHFEHFRVFMGRHPVAPESRIGYADAARGMAH